MFGRRAAGKRFSLLLLEEEEDYVRDWVVVAKWPEAVAGNWQKSSQLSGRLRLCTRSLFFEPDDVRIPVVRSGRRRGPGFAEEGAGGGGGAGGQHTQ